MTTDLGTLKELAAIELAYLRRLQIESNGVKLGFKTTYLN